MCTFITFSLYLYLYYLYLSFLGSANNHQHETSLHNFVSRNLKQAHTTSLESFHITYPLTKRNNIPITSSLPHSIITNSIIATSYFDPKSSSIHQHLIQHFNYVQSGHHLHDGMENIVVGSIVAVAPSRKNGIPWFGKVLQLLPSSLEVLWLHKESTTNYFYLDDSIAIIH